jgi:hypothetical protein
MKLVALFLFTSLVMIAQDKNELPYYEIPEAPENYKAGTVAARMIDGLGFRFYWVTEGLTKHDLEYKPSESGKSTAETVQHIFELSEMILNTAMQQVNDFTVEPKALTYKEMRNQTLLNLKKASDILLKQDNLEDHKLIFKSTNGTREFPFWNLINGPIADAIWHCGQVVSFRRSSGNPYNSKASVLTGKVKN